MITKEHKKIAINVLYGFMEGNGSALPECIMNMFKHKNLDPINVQFKVIRKPNCSPDTPFDEFDWGCWSISLTLNDETYEVKRDFQEEFENDIKHKNHNDEYFYESEECYSHIKYEELINEL